MKRVLSNSVILLVSNITGKIIFFLATLLIIRNADYTEYGEFNYLFSIAAALAVFLDLGIDKIFIREISRDLPEKNNLFHLIVFKIGIYALLAAIMFLWGPKKPVFFILLSAVFLKSVYNACVCVIEARQKMAREAFLILTGNIAFLVLVLLKPGNIVSVSYAYLASAALQVAGGLILAGPVAMRAGSFSKIIKYLKAGIPIGIIIICGGIEFRLDSIIIGSSIGMQASGYYGSVYTVMAALMMVPNAFTAALYPHISSGRDAGKLDENIARSVIILTVAAIAVLIPGWLAAGRLLPILFGKTVPEQVPILRLLLLSVVPIFFSASYIFYLYSRNLQSKALFIVSLKLAMNAVLNIILIPKFGITAAAWVMLFTECIGAFAFRQIYIKNRKMNEG